MHFNFSFKRTLTSFKFFFWVINTHIVDMIEFVLIKISFNIFMWFLLSTYFFIFVLEDVIHCNVNDRIILFLPVKSISWYGIVPVVLGKSNINIIRTKVSQYLAFSWLIPWYMYETGGFGVTIWLVYIYFSALASALTHIILSMWWVCFSYLYPAVTSTGGIYTNSFYKKVILHLSIYTLQFSFVQTYWHIS